MPPYRSLVRTLNCQKDNFSHNTCICSVLRMKHLIPTCNTKFEWSIRSVFLIRSYGAPLAQRASYLALHSSLFGPVAQLIMIILSLTALNLC